MADEGDEWQVVAKKPKAKKKQPPPQPPPPPQSKTAEASSSAKRSSKPKPSKPPRQGKEGPGKKEEQGLEKEVEDTAVRISRLAVEPAVEGKGGEDQAAAATPASTGAAPETPAPRQPATSPATTPTPAAASAPEPKKSFSSWAAMAKDKVPPPPAPPLPPPYAASTMNGGSGSDSSSSKPATAAPWGPTTGGSATGAAGEEERRPTVDEVVDLLAGTRAPGAAASSFPRHQRGLANTGNACFRNVILQALLSCAPFHALLRALRPWVLLHQTPPPPKAAAADSSDGPEAARAREAELRGLIPTWLSLARLATALEDPNLVASDSHNPPPGVAGNGQRTTKTGKKAQVPQPKQQQQDGAFAGLGLQPLTPDDYLSECFAAFRSSEAGEQQDPHDFSSFLLSRLHEEAAAAQKARERWVLEAAAAAEGERAEVLVKEQEGEGEEEEEEEDGWQEVGKKGTVARVNVSGQSTHAGGGAGGKRFESSAVTRVFHGRQRSDLRRSQASRNVSATVQAFESMQLEVAAPAIQSVGEAVAAAFSEETIPTAPGSKSSGFKKRLVLDALPPVLVLQLKRFTWDAERGQPLKICKPIEYPTTLSFPTAYLSPALRAASRDKDPRYALFAVVMHHGRFLGGGHYTAYCQGSQGAAEGRAGGWYVYDDERVEEASDAQARKNAEQAYLFFYVRVEEGGTEAGGQQEQGGEGKR